MVSVENVLKSSGYSPKAIELYMNHVNVGQCDNADICLGYTGPCGDTIEFFLTLHTDVIQDAKFQAIGCEGAFICGSALTELIKGKTISQAERIEKEQVIEYLGGLPEEKHDCVCLSIHTLRHTLEEFKKRQESQGSI